MLDNVEETIKYTDVNTMQKLNVLELSMLVLYLNELVHLNDDEERIKNTELYRKKAI